jgi:hypothetical protein
MDRRGFLGALIGLAAAPVLAKIPRGFALSSAGVIVPEAPGYVLATLPRAALLVGLRLVGNETVSRIGTLNISRPNSGSIVRFNYNQAGGVVFWRPPPEGAIMCREDAPLVVNASAGTDLRLEYYDLNDNDLHILDYRAGEGQAGPWEQVELQSIGWQRRLSY